MLWRDLFKIRYLRLKISDKNAKILNKEILNRILNRIDLFLRGYRRIFDSKF